jgi:transposase
MGGVEVKKKQRTRQNRVYSLEFKVTAVQRMLSGESVVALSRVLEVHPNLLYYWLKRYRKQGAERLRGPGRPSMEECHEVVATPGEEAARRMAELERKVGRQSLEVDFLKKAFKRVKESRQRSTQPGGTASTGRSGQ